MFLTCPLLKDKAMNTRHVISSEKGVYDKISTCLLDMLDVFLFFFMKNNY